MKSELSIIDPKEYGLSLEGVKTIDDAFSPKVIERNLTVKAYELIIGKEINAETSKEARELRLRIVKIRTGITDIHKTEKAMSIAIGKFVDARKNKEVLPCQQMEEKLAEIEKHVENQEAEKAETLRKERTLELEKYNVHNIDMLNVGIMPVAVWDTFLTGTIAGYNQKIEEEKKAKEEARKKEEAERKARADAEEKARKEAEEKRLKDLEIARKKAKLEAEERAKQDAIKAKKEAEQKIESEKLKAKEAEAKHQKEIEEIQRKNEEVEAKRIADEKADVEKERQLELSKGDSDKVLDLKSDLEALKVKYNFDSAKNQKMYHDVSELINKIIKHINQ